MPDITPEQAAAEAVHKVKNAQQAVEMSRHIQLEALLTSEIFIKTVEAAVVKGFSASAGEGRYIDVTRIPLICQSIVGIDEKLDKLVTQDQFWPVKTLVYGITGLLLSGTIGALLVVAFIK